MPVNLNRNVVTTLVPVALQLNPITAVVEAVMVRELDASVNHYGHTRYIPGDKFSEQAQAFVAAIAPILDAECATIRATIEAEESANQSE